MSRIKNLYDWMLNAMLFHKMENSPECELIPFAAGLRDGSEDSINIVNSFSKNQRPWYKQGYMEGEHQRRTGNWIRLDKDNEPSEQGTDPWSDAKWMG